MRRFLPILLITVLMIAAYFFGLGEYLTFERLKEQREVLQLAVNNYPVLAPLTFIIIYIVATALSLPGGAFLSICGGFLFPQPFCTLYVVLGATVGAITIFEAARTALGDSLRQRAGAMMQKMEKGVREDGWSYLLFLRLVPLFPFWLVNLAPAFFEVSLFTFAWTTFVGIIPGAFVFTQAGAGLGAIFDSGETLSIGAIFNTQVKIALAALGIFALIPIVLKNLRKTKDDR